jgi:hypothetical protein
MPSLLELVEAERARRDNGVDMRPAFVFMIWDRKPRALTDVEEAVRGIAQHADEGGREMVCVTTRIAQAVTPKLRAAYRKALDNFTSHNRSRDVWRPRAKSVRQRHSLVGCRA